MLAALWLTLGLLAALLLDKQHALMVDLAVSRAAISAGKSTRPTGRAAKRAAAGRNPPSSHCCNACDAIPTTCCAPTFSTTTGDCWPGQQRVCARQPGSRPTGCA